MRINSYSRNISPVLCVIGYISTTTTNAAEDPASLYLQFHNEIASGKVNTLEKLYTYLSKSTITEWKKGAPESQDLHLFSYVDLHRYRIPKVVNTLTNEDGVVLTLEVRVGREPVPYTAHVLMVKEDRAWED